MSDKIANIHIRHDSESGQVYTMVAVNEECDAQVHEIVQRAVDAMVIELNDLQG